MTTPIRTELLNLAVSYVRLADHIERAGMIPGEKNKAGG